MSAWFDADLQSLDDFIAKHRLADSVEICLGGGAVNDWLALTDAVVKKPLAQLVRKCTQLTELRFDSMRLNAECESLLTTHVTQLAVSRLPADFDAFCFFHRAAAVDAIQELELSSGSLGVDQSALVTWIANSARLRVVTLRDLVFLTPDLFPALMASTTLTSLRLIGLGDLDDDLLRRALDQRPRRDWQLREFDLRHNHGLTPSALFTLATSLRDLRLESLGIEILGEPLDRPHARRLVDIVWRQPTLKYLWLNALVMAPPERIALLGAVADRLPALEQFVFEPAPSEPDDGLDMSEALADAFLGVIDSLKYIEVFGLAGWRWPESRRGAFLHAVERRYSLHRVIDTIRKQDRFVEYSDEQKEWLEAVLARHWTGRWSCCCRRLSNICCALAQLDWPAYVTLDVLDQLERLSDAEHSHKIRAIILVKNAFRKKYNKA